MASCRIWDALGFKRIGRVKGCGNLRSYPDELVDAIIYGRDLGQEGDEYISEERFEKIKFYLKNGKYPNGADRAEKSRLRSAATHYKLVPETENEPEKLMLKDKEVIAEPQKQYELARKIHLEQHGGINKTTASIAEKYHWVRIKDTVSQVIKNCSECRDQSKLPALKPEKSNSRSDNASPVPAANLSQQSAMLESHSPLVRLLQSETSQVILQPQADPMAAHGIINYEVPVDPRIMDGIRPTFPEMSDDFSDPLMALTTASDPTLIEDDQGDGEGEFTRELRSAAFTLDA